MEDPPISLCLQQAPCCQVGASQPEAIKKAAFDLSLILFLASIMSDPKYPYETRLDILHQQLEVIDIQKFAETIDFKWFNQTLCKVNDSVVRLGIIEGEYHWHKHDRDD